MKIRVLLLDETRNWAPSIAERAGRIFGAYMYDPESCTHCCELTPSYELTFIESIPEACPKSECDRETLVSDMAEGDAQTDPIHYMHVRTVDALPEIPPGYLKQGTYLYDQEREADVWESIEEAREYWQGNPDY